MRLLRCISVAIAAVCAVSLSIATTSARAEGAAENYQSYCAACHGADRLGGTGPALLPENLERLRYRAPILPHLIDPPLVDRPQLIRRQP